MSTFEQKIDMTPNFGKIKIDQGVKIWYRTAGKWGAPTILLLHGFPSSSNMFRNLIPLLAARFYVVAPDIPGFGFTEYPEDYEFNFANLTNSIEQFLKALNIKKYSVYVFDYGAPIGFRLALKSPSAITGIVVQNGNAYDEGLDDRFWEPIINYWEQEQTDPEYVKIFTDYLQDEKNVKSQYLTGVDDSVTVDPSNYTLDFALLSRPGQTAIQIKLFHDYETNVDMYPDFQEFLRDAKIPVLVTWGWNDQIFTVEGAESYRKDVKCLKIVYFKTGHFALETHAAEIAHEIVAFLYQKVIR